MTKFFNIYKKLLIPKIHLLCNDNSDSTKVINSGTLGEYGTASVNTQSMTTTGKINNALHLFTDLSGQNINLDTFSQHISSDINGSLYFWFLPLLNVQETGEFYFILGNETDNITIYAAIVPTFCDITIWCMKDGVYQWADQATNLSSTDWHHVSIVQNGTSVVGKVGTTTMQPVDGGAYDLDRSVWIAGLGTTLSSIAISSRGVVDDIRYYSEALSSSQSSKIYNNGTGTEAEIYK